MHVELWFYRIFVIFRFCSLILGTALSVSWKGLENLGYSSQPTPIYSNSASQKVMRSWKRLSREVIDAPFLEVLKPGLMKPWAVWSDEWQPCPWQGDWNWVALKVPSNPNHVEILWSHHHISYLAITVMITFPGWINHYICLTIREGYVQCLYSSHIMSLLHINLGTLGGQGWGWGVTLLHKGRASVHSERARHAGGCEACEVHDTWFSQEL